MPKESGVRLARPVLAKLNARVPNKVQMSKQLGVGRVTLTRVLTGAQMPSRSLLKKICDAVDLEVSVVVVVDVWPKGERKPRGGGAAVEMK
jgi:transcriptional regulator with XRE-family HTH domain